MKGEEFQPGYSDGDVDTNRTTNRDLGSLVAERYSRRQTVMGGLKASSAALSSWARASSSVRSIIYNTWTDAAR